MHFNPFHDPKNGQFTSGGSGGVISSLRNRMSLSKKDRAEKKEEQDKAKYEAERQRAIKSGNATEVLKFKNDLSIQELQSALTRINLENNLARISREELATGKSSAEKFFDTIGKGANYLNTASNLIEATQRFAKNASKKEDSLSQQLAKEFLNNESKSDHIDMDVLQRANDYLNKITNIERIAKGQNGKNKQ